MTNQAHDPKHLKTLLMDHYRNPRNRGSLEKADRIARGKNPRCGDDVEIGIRINSNDSIEAVSFRGRGCSICVASASMLTIELKGRKKKSAQQLVERVNTWISADGIIPSDNLSPLLLVKNQFSRRRCILLPWEALSELL